MNLDWYPGQRVVCIRTPNRQIRGTNFVDLPPSVQIGEIYVVARAWAGPGNMPGTLLIFDTEGVWLTLDGLGDWQWFHSDMFLPVEPKAMKELRELLAPMSKAPVKEDA